MPGLPKRKVLAAVVKFMEAALMRVGNDEYARQIVLSDSRRCTTIMPKIRGSKVSFAFRGRAGDQHEFDVEDPHLAEIAAKCAGTAGAGLFQYVGVDGEVDIGSVDVNEYLRDISGQDFTG